MQREERCLQRLRRQVERIISMEDTMRLAQLRAVDLVIDPAKT